MSTYNQLRRIIPPDQALASKGLQAGLEQVKNIFDTTLPALAAATEGLESNTDLPAINNLTEPLPANVITFYTQTLATGSGVQGLLLLTDLIGTAAGVENAQFSSTITTLNEMTSQGDFASLTGSQQVYGTMETAITGVWTVLTDPGDPFVDPPIPPTYTTTIPIGWVATGSYTGTSVSASIQSAFTDGLNPAMISAVNGIIALNPAQTATLNSNWNSIATQIITEQNNLNTAGISFANLIPNTQPWGLVYNLASSGLDIVEGGTAYVLQSVANTATQGGQAMISTMREARNQVRLNSAGMQTDITISDEYPEPEADLGTAQYTVAQATSQKII
jgi:hypothetical protein